MHSLYMARDMARSSQGSHLLTHNISYRGIHDEVSNDYAPRARSENPSSQICIAKIKLVMPVICFQESAWQVMFCLKVEL